MSELNVEIDEVIADRIAKFHTALLQHEMYQKKENEVLCQRLVSQYMEWLVLQYAQRMTYRGEEAVQ